jgi:hypothetical protein
MVNFFDKYEGRIMALVLALGLVVVALDMLVWRVG